MDWDKLSAKKLDMKRPSDICTYLDEVEFKIFQKNVIPGCVTKA